MIKANQLRERRQDIYTDVLKMLEHAFINRNANGLSNYDYFTKDLNLAKYLELELVKAGYSVVLLDKSATVWGEYMLAISWDE